MIPWLRQIYNSFTDEVRLLHQCRICKQPDCIYAERKDFSDADRKATSEELRLCGEFKGGVSRG